MINLIEGYYIDGGDLSYALKKSTGSVNKDNEPTYRTIGYYSTVEGAIKGCYKDICRVSIKELGKEIISLEQAANIFEGIEKRLEEIIPDVFKKR